MQDNKKLIRLAKSCIGDAEKQAVLDVMERQFLGMGEEVQQFEQALTTFFGRPAVCVVNGTAALHLALQAAGIGTGDEVLVQSLTYVASFQAISATGATPVACDIDASTLTLDWHDAERRLTPRTKALMPMHYSGGVGELKEMYDFANRHGLRVIEDAAHAFGTNYQNKRIGSFGDIACFSFDGIKNITSGEGGCIVTDDETILSQVRDARLLGVERDTEQRFGGERSWQFNVTQQGWRYHMSNIMAAIGHKQLEKYPAFASQRQSLAKYYDERLAPYTHILRIQHDYNQIVPHTYVVRAPGLQDRDALRTRMQAKNIQTGVHYQPNHRLALYDSDKTQDLPVTDQLHSELVTLPLHPELKEQEIQRVVDVLLTELAHEA